ncbi:MAG: DUF4124 domain-containing protein [Dokdonella sp.]
MKLWIVFAVSVGFATAASGAEQAVFKCVKSDGSVVFSAQTCGKGAQEVKMRAGSRAANVEQSPRSAAGSSVAPADAVSAKIDAVRDISEGIDDSHCRDDARKLYVEPNTSSSARAKAELKALEGRSWVGGAASTRQILDETDQTHMASLRSLIATEESRADATRADSQKRVDEALTKCDVRKREVQESHKHVN